MSLALLRATDSLKSAASYYRARYYDSQIGRFVSEDPAGFNAGINFYRYVGNDPAGWTDPLGLCKRCGIKRGPQYNISGTVPVGTTFYLHAEFLNDAEHDPKCCEVRQFVQWDRAPTRRRKGWHVGFSPGDDAPGEWHEDRALPTASCNHESRYGRRTGPYSCPNGGDMYSNDSYDGNDTPGGYVTGVTLSFKLQVVDVCNNNEVVIETRKPLRVRF